MAGPATRRAMLAGAALLPVFLAGCKGLDALGTPPQPAPDVGLLQAAVAAEELMVARYEAALRQAPTVPEATLRALILEHQQHLGQLRARFVAGSPQAARAATPSPAGPGARHSPAPGPSGPAEPSQLASYLAGAEQAASDYLLRQLRLAPPALAQLLASISASEATHVPVLLAAGPK